MEERSKQTDELVRSDRIAVTAIVATYNEVRHITHCLDGLLAQTGLDGDVEVVVIDGMSADGTQRVIRDFPEFGSKIRLVENRRRLQVYAWNLGLQAARGEYVAMISAHAEYRPDYFASCLEVLRRTGATAVGGVQKPCGEGTLGRAIAWCMSSPFGMGNARFRYTDKEEETDSVFGLFIRRETIMDAGGYDERVPFDEDSELNYRLRQRGAKLVVSPTIHVSYHVRRSLKALWKQMYRYGYWRRYTQLLHSTSVPVRVLVPPLFVGGLALSVALLPTPLRLFSVLIPIAYTAFLIAAAVRAAKQIGSDAIAVPVALATMHFSYGWGWWRAFVKFGFERRKVHDAVPLF
ncbi:MAG: glycosyltransferase family 2 protein [Candidatus Eremiobacteraeota bacterium]|nr:glycosyltransferase family 2 protein [Candidatus Eremiobacteraeota bacterium]